MNLPRARLRLVTLWIMSDGSAMRDGGQEIPKEFLAAPTSSDGLKLSTHGFSVDDQQRLASVLTNLYGLKVTLHKDRQYYCLYIWAQSVSKVKALVMPYMLPSCLYKLP